MIFPKGQKKGDDSNFTILKLQNIVRTLGLYMRVLGAMTNLTATWNSIKNKNKCIFAINFANGSFFQFKILSHGDEHLRV